MADEPDDPFDDDFFATEAVKMLDAVVSSSYSNPTQPQPQPQVYAPPPPISYSPPRHFSQTLNNHNHTHPPANPFDPAFTLHSSNLHPSRTNQEDKQHEIDRLKDELARISKLLTNLEQECLELRKDREKSEKHLRLVVPVNGSEGAETFFTKKSNLKNKDPIEDPSAGTKGVISCKAVGVQTDEHALSTDVMIKKNLSVSRKLAGIWEPQSERSPRTNLVTKLFVACEADLHVLFGFLGLNIPSNQTTTKMAPNHCIQSADAAKVSHLYLTLTQIGYDTRKLGDLLEALVDLCYLQNISLRAARGFETHFEHGKPIVPECTVLRDNVIINDPSVNKSYSEMEHLFCEITNETSIPLQNKDNSRKESQPSISCSKWFSLFQTMHQVVTRQCEECIRVEALSIMNILLLRTDAFTEREMYGEVAVFQSISKLLRKEARPGVQKQAVHLLYLLLNCPNLMSMCSSSSKEEGTSAEVSSKTAEIAPTFQGLGSLLDGLADCLAFHGNGAPKTLVLELQRNTIILLAFLVSSGRRGYEILLGRNISRTNFIYLILQTLGSAIDLDTSDNIQPPEAFRERTLLIRETLILLNRLVSNSQYSTPVLRLLTNRKDMAMLTIDIATRLSRKNKWLWQPDSHMRESEIVDLARIFKKRVFAFLGDVTSEK